MNPNTFIQRLVLEAVRPNWTHVLLSDGERLHFLNLPIYWDQTLEVGVTILENDPEAAKRAKLSATTQA